MKKFNVTISGNYLLTVDEIWPDGDAPENPTVRDVVKAMQDSASSIASLIEEWNLESDLDMYVVGEDGKIADVDDRLRLTAVR